MPASARSEAQGQYGGFGSGFLMDPNRQARYNQSLMAGDRSWQNAAIAAANRPAPAPPSLVGGAQLTPPAYDFSSLSDLLGGWGAGGGGAGGGAINYTTSIDAGPVWSPEATARATADISSGGQSPLAFETLPGLRLTQEQQGTLNSQAMRSGHQASQRAGVDFGRMAAQGNASQQLATQSARSNEGLALGGLGAQLQRQQLAQQAKQRQEAISLVESLMGMV